MRRLAAFLLLLGLGASQVSVVGCPMGDGPSGDIVLEAADAPRHGTHGAHGAHGAADPDPSHGAAHDEQGHEHHGPHPDRDCQVLIGCGTAVIASAGAPELRAGGSVLDIDVTTPADAGLAIFPSAEPPPPRLPV